jgi:hypothetical protein
VNSSATARLATLISVISTSTLLAQSITVGAVTHNHLSVSASTLSGNIVTASLPAGTDILEGMVLSTKNSLTATGRAVTSFTLNEGNSEISANLRATASSTAGQAAFASTGLSQVLVQIDLAHPMTLEVGMEAIGVSCTGHANGQVTIDIGNDGSPELVLTALNAFWEEASNCSLVDFQAGTTDILISTELDIAPHETQSNFVIMNGRLTVKPSHTEATAEGAGCGIELEVAPLFNYNVQFIIEGEQSGDVPFLALGGFRQQLPLPMSMNCDLLITPDWMIPMQNLTPQLIPLICMGPGQAFAQAAIFRPQLASSSSGPFLMSQRVAIMVR